MNDSQGRSNSENNKRILKNTLALYFRQIITMFVALFTSRIVLQTLGVTDFGINNVVGGVVAMLSFLTSSLAGTTQRFLSVELGKNDHAKLKQVFANSLSLHVIFILLTIALAETVGLWFLQNKLVIPPERAEAAFWVYQFSVASFAISVFFAPFEGAIRAHEKFSFYAKMSIFDVIMKLAIAYSLVILPYDKLVALSFLGVCVVFIGRMIMYAYCRIHFEECRIRLSWAKDNIRQLLGYNFYRIIREISAVIRHQGINIILNLYYGPVMNAAQGIATQVRNSVSSFIYNAIIAAEPQIVMSFAQNDRPRLWTLITRTSRLYFYLFLILALPFILEIDTALYIWLGYYPKYTAVFVRLFLLEALIGTLASIISTVDLAVGKLRTTTIIHVSIRLSILTIAIFVGLNNLSPIYIYASVLFFEIVFIISFLLIVIKKHLDFSLRKYLIDIILPISKTSIIVASLPIVLHYFFSTSMRSSCIVGFFTLIWSAIIIFYVGLDRREKQMIIDKLPPFLRGILWVPNNE